MGGPEHRDTRRNAATPARTCIAIASFPLTLAGRRYRPSMN